jgi:hypothetical protein
MTGMDPLLNRRISSIFLNEFEAFLKTLSELPNHENGDPLQFSLHKIRPSLVIFELDSAIKLYDKLSARKREGEEISQDDSELLIALDETKKNINENNMKLFHFIEDFNNI